MLCSISLDTPSFPSPCPHLYEFLSPVSPRVLTFCLGCNLCTCHLIYLSRSEVERRRYDAEMRGGKGVAAGCKSGFGISRLSLFRLRDPRSEIGVRSLSVPRSSPSFILLFLYTARDPPLRAAAQDAAVLRSPAALAHHFIIIVVVVARSIRLADTAVPALVPYPTHDTCSSLSRPCRTGRSRRCPVGEQEALRCCRCRRRRFCRPRCRLPQL